MESISIVILNYMNWKDTIECVESLYLQKNQNFKIIIVDNNSPNESFEKLSMLYKNSKNIHLLKSMDNVGYAQGNNIGIRYSLDHLNIFKVLVVNNDTIFTDDNYIDYLARLDYDETIGAIGSKIIGSDGMNQNPVYADVKLLTVLKSVFGSHLRFFGVSKFLKNKNRLKKLNKHRDKFILHGSSMFFTENYLRKAKGFYPETFLFYEENILAIVFKKLGLKMIYDDSIFIYHKEDQSTAMSYSNVSQAKLKYEKISTLIALKVLLTSKNRIVKEINKYKILK